MSLALTSFASDAIVLADGSSSMLTTVTLAGGLKDQNGPQLQSGIWQCLGGGMIIGAAVLFGTISV